MSKNALFLKQNQKMAERWRGDYGDLHYISFYLSCFIFLTGQAANDRMIYGSIYLIDRMIKR